MLGGDATTVRARAGSAKVAALGGGVTQARTAKDTRRLLGAECIVKRSNEAARRPPHQLLGFCRVSEKETERLTTPIPSSNRMSHNTRTAESG